MLRILGQRNSLEMDDCVCESQEGEKGHAGCIIITVGCLQHASPRTRHAIHWLSSYPNHSRARCAGPYSISLALLHT